MSNIELTLILIWSIPTGIFLIANTILLGDSYADNSYNRRDIKAARKYARRFIMSPLWPIIFVPMFVRWAWTDEDKVRLPKAKAR